MGLGFGVEGEMVLNGYRNKTLKMFSFEKREHIFSAITQRCGVCVCVCACARACVCACMCVGVRACGRFFVCLIFVVVTAAAVN